MELKPSRLINILRVWIEARKGVILVVVCVVGFTSGIIIAERQISPWPEIKGVVKVFTGYSSESQLKASNIEKAEYADRFWADELKKGGYILHIRHGMREKWDDVVAYDALELADNLNAREYKWARATCLTERGVEDSRLIGRVFSHLKIEVGYVISSPSCRARETAIFAFNRVDEVSPALLHRTAMRASDHIPMGQELRRLVDSKSNFSKNLVLSGHGGTLSYDFINGVGIIDEMKVMDIDKRLETGIIVIRRNLDGSYTAVHKFRSILDLAKPNILLQSFDSSQGKFLHNGESYDPANLKSGFIFNHYNAD